MAKQLNPKDNTTRQELLKVGIELFGKYGYRSVTTKSINEYSGISSALVAYHFGNKENYYHEVFKAITDELINWFQAITPTDLSTMSELELKQQIERSITHFFDWMFSEHGTCGTYIFFREMVSQEHPQTQAEASRAVSFITPLFINLFDAYYKKINKPEVNATFIWIILISLAQNISLHLNAPEEARQAFQRAQIQSSILDLILNKYS